jgi:hypothetical protein
MFANNGTSMLTILAQTAVTTGMEQSEIAGYRPFGIRFAMAIKAPCDDE